MKEKEVINNNFDEDNIKTLKKPFDFKETKVYTLIEENNEGSKIKPSTNSMKKTVKDLLD